MPQNVMRRKPLDTLWEKLSFLFWSYRISSWFVAYIAKCLAPFTLTSAGIATDNVREGLFATLTWWTMKRFGIGGDRRAYWWGKLWSISIARITSVGRFKRHLLNTRYYGRGLNITACRRPGLLNLRITIVLLASGTRLLTVHDHD